jgi:aarF domain-containing kinase
MFRPRGGTHQCLYSSKLQLFGRYLRRNSTGSSSISSDQNRRRRKLLAVAAAAVTVGTATAAYGVHYFHDHFGGTEGLYRALVFYSLAVPKYVIYRYHQYMNSPQETWDALDRETSQQGLQLILQLRGFFTKCGQMCAANVGDAFPPIWQETMAVLQDQCPTEDFDTVVLPIIKEELGEKRFHELEWIDPVPIGSASIGQVHRAMLKDGSPVVIKICYPHVERLLRGDVRTIRAFCEVAQPVHVPGIKEVERTFHTEFDYRDEAQNLDLVRSNLTSAGIAGPDGLCTVPRPFREYCTKRVLVMEELKGDKLPEALKTDVRQWAEIAGVSVEELAKQQTSKTAEEFGSIIAALDAERKVQNAWNRIYNTTMGVFGTFRPYADKSSLPLNHAKIVDDLISIHGHEILVDGVYNADCHPGNILLCRTKDGSPQLGLIDYGQTKKLTKKERHLLCQIIIALADNDRDKVVQLMKVAGFTSKRMDPDVIFVYAKVSYDEDSKELTNGKHIQMVGQFFDAFCRLYALRAHNLFSFRTSTIKFMEEIQSRDPIIALPECFLMVGRTSIFLRGLAHALKQSRSCAKIWRPIAERVLREDL